MRGLIIYIVGIVLTLFAEAGRLKEAVTAIDAALASLFSNTATTHGCQTSCQAAAAAALATTLLRRCLLVLHGRLALGRAVILPLRGTILSLRRAILALGRAVLTLGGTVRRLGMLRVTAATAAIVILSRHGIDKRSWCCCD